MKILKYILTALFSASVVFGAFTPASSSNTVMVDSSHKIIFPATIATASFGYLSSAYIGATTISADSMSFLNINANNIITKNLTVSTNAYANVLTVSTMSATTLKATTGTFSNISSTNSYNIALTTNTLACNSWGGFSGDLNVGGTFIVDDQYTTTSISGGAILTTTVSLDALNYTSQRYAVFDIPLTSNYRDFTIKAFTQSSNAVFVVFEYSSWNVSSPDDNIWEVQPDVYFTNPNSGIDSRFWFKQGTASIRNTVPDTGGGVIVVKETGSWFTETNKGLLWVYALSGISGIQTNSSGNQIWHPITPKWTSYPIEP